MSALLEREKLLTSEDFQTEDTLPECMRSYQPFVLLWSEKRPAQSDSKLDLSFSDSYHGITDVNYSMHDTVYSTKDDNGTVFVDCNL